MNSNSPLGCVLLVQGQLAAERRLTVVWRRHLGPQRVPMGGSPVAHFLCSQFNKSLTLDILTDVQVIFPLANSSHPF